MSVPMHWTRSDLMMAEHRFHRGDIVRFQFGLRKVQGSVKEDRGPIGVKGRRLYSIEFHFSPPSDPSAALVELPAEDLELVQEAVDSKPNRP